MGLGDFTGSLGLESINLSGLFDKIQNFFVIFLLVLILGAIAAALVIQKRKNKNKGQGFKIGWWVEVDNEMRASHVDDVEEVVIPGTTLRIFYNRKKDLWITRFTRGVGTNLFYVCLTPDNQMINFSIPSISKRLAEANLKYDHTDMLWAAENAREYIKKNYKDKAVKWWQLYQNTIATAALIIVFTLCFVMIIFFMRNIMKDLSGLISHTSELVKIATTNVQSSGVVGA